MSEREPRERPYFQEDLPLGRAPLRGRDTPLFLHLHRGAERIAGGTLVPLAHREGGCTYFHGKPYVVEPEITLTVATYPRPRPGGAVGEVAGSRVAGVRRREIGQAQAWHYPRDRLLLLWECYLLDRYQSGDPGEDFAQQALWQGFERALIARCPETERVATTWEDVYPRPA